MLKTRVIPTLLLKDVGLVKGVGFDSWRRVDTVMPAVKVYNMREVDELILLDITASEQNREPDYDLVKDVSEECFIPFTVGGGIKNIDQIKELLRSGADKVAVNSACFENPELVKEASDKFGVQCIVVSIDVKKHDDGKYYCYSNSGKVNTGREVCEWVEKMETLGAGEILITSIERDGTMKGYDIELIRSISENVSIPVIASGGAGNYKHMLEAIKEGKADAVAAASIFHFTEQTPREAKMFLGKNGVAVRNSKVTF